MIIKKYISSLSKGGMKTVEDILATAPGVPSMPGDIDEIEYRRIVKPSLHEFEAVNSNQINDVLTETWSADAAMWRATEQLDTATRNLKSYIDNSLRVIGSSVSRLDSVLRNITSSYRTEDLFDSLYIERFDGMAGTDIEDTNAMISGGHVEIPQRRTVISVSSHKVDSASCPLDSLGRSWSDGMLTLWAYSQKRLTAGIPEARMNGLVTASSFSLDGTKLVNELMVTMPHGGDLIEVAVHVGGRKTVIHRSEPKPMFGRMRFSFDPMPVTKVSVITRCGEAASSAEIERRSPLDSEGLLDRNGSPGTMTNTSGYLSTIYRYSTTVGVFPSLSIKNETAQWKSNPITIDGNILRLKIDSTQTEDNTSNIGWFVSVGGSSWKPIVRKGRGLITNEPVAIGPDGRGYLRHKGDVSISPQVKGIPADASVSSVLSSSGDVMIGIQVSGMTGGTAYVSYTSAVNSQFIEFDDIDTVNGSRIVDATTDGQLGERFISTTNKSVTLKSDPVSTPDVYVSGVKAVNIDTINAETSLDDPTLDLDTVYFRIVGRRVFFADDNSNISVYYKHMRSSVVIKAILNRGSMLSSTPRIESVAVGIVHN